MYYSRRQSIGVILLKEGVVSEGASRAHLSVFEEIIFLSYAHGTWGGTPSALGDRKLVV